MCRAMSDCLRGRGLPSQSAGPSLSLNARVCDRAIIIGKEVKRGSQEAACQSVKEGVGFSDWKHQECAGWSWDGGQIGDRALRRPCSF